jgi:predicted RNA binding protein with dsRBD fold (UPF0201 family)
MECLVKVSSKINATEDPDKVQKAIQNIFPTGSFQINENKITLTGDCTTLENLKNIMEQRKIRATARSIMESNMKNKTTEAGTKESSIEFTLSKQTAFVEVVNFVAGTPSPLGDINVKIITLDIEEFLDWFVFVEDMEEE